MRMRFGLVAVLAMGLFETSAGARSGKDAFGDPLPKGAKGRLGSERMRNLDSSALLMPDGKTILSQSTLGIGIIDTSTGLVMGKLTVPKGEYAVAPSLVSADGKRAASVRFDSIAIVELETGKKICEIKRTGHSSDGIASLSKDGATLALGGNVDEKAKDKSVVVRVWDVNSNKEVAAIKVAQNTTARVMLSGDGKILATWGYHTVPFKPGVETDPATDPARAVEIWDAATGEPIEVRNAASGEVLHKFKGHARPVSALAFSKDGKMLASGSVDSTILVWDLTSGKE